MNTLNKTNGLSAFSTSFKLLSQNEFQPIIVMYFVLKFITSVGTETLVNRPRFHIISIYPYLLYLFIITKRLFSTKLSSFFFISSAILEKKNIYIYTGGSPYPRVIRSKTYCGYVKPRIIPNTIYNAI